MTLILGDSLEEIYRLTSFFNNNHSYDCGHNKLGAWIRKDGYNISFWIKFDDAIIWVIRFPMIGVIALELVDEKLKMEVVIMKFLL